MIYLNAGNLWTDSYLDKVIDLNNQHAGSVRVASLFGSIGSLTPTARSVDRLPHRDWPFIEKYVKKARDNNIHIRYTLNQSCIGSLQDFASYWYKELYFTTQKLHEAGVDEWTVASPLIVSLLHKTFPDDFIEVSTIAEITTPEEMAHWMEIGARGVNLSTSINRDPLRITAIVKTGTKVAILANEACLYRCPFRRECYNLSSHNSMRGEMFFDFYPFRWCNMARIKNPVEWVKSRIVLPQWMNLYQRHTNVRWFKIAYRTHPEEVALPILTAYMEQHYDGNLLDLWPTISHLGSTQEPKERQYISCHQLDELGFIEHFFEPEPSLIEELPCNDTLRCGIDCQWCYKATKKALSTHDKT